MSQILLLETLVKLVCGLALVVAPLSVIKLLGLPCPPTGFWPRLTGSLLIGLAAATFIELKLPGSHGLGLYGLIAINLIAVAVLVGMSIANAGASTRRGEAVLWISVAIVMTLALAEIAVI